MSERNDNRWAWIVGIGIGAIAGAAITALAVSCSEDEPMRYNAAPRRRIREMTEANRESSQQRGFLAIEGPTERDPVLSRYVTEIKETQSQKCMICYQNLSALKPETRLGCQHVFHSDCLRKWLEQKNEHCPICIRRV